MIKGLVPPIAGILGYFMFGAKFSWYKIGAIGLTIVGIMLGCLVQLYYETQNGTFRAGGLAIMLILLSACGQAAQATLEERIYRKSNY